MAKKKFSELRRKMMEEPGAEQREREARDRLAEQLEAYQHTLAQIRKAREFTQENLARILEVSQPEVSRIEHQADLFVSTLRSYLRAMGGDLQLVAAFEDGYTVVHMDDVSDAAFRPEHDSDHCDDTDPDAVLA